MCKHSPFPCLPNLYSPLNSISHPFFIKCFLVTTSLNNCIYIYHAGYKDHRGKKCRGSLTYFLSSSILAKNIPSILFLLFRAAHLSNFPPQEGHCVLCQFRLSVPYWYHCRWLQCRRFLGVFWCLLKPRRFPVLREVLFTLPLIFHSHLGTVLVLTLCISFSAAFWLMNNFFIVETEAR